MPYREYGTNPVANLVRELGPSEVNPTHMDWYYRHRVLGHLQKDIAAEHGVSCPAVSQAIRIAEKRMARFVSEAADKVRLRQSLLYEHMARESLAEWEKSKGRIETTERVRDGVDDDGEPVRSKEVTTRAMLGEVKYLQEARQCLDKIDKLYGVEAPRRTEHSGDPTTVNLTQSLTVDRIETLERESPEQFAKVMQALGSLQQATKGMEVPE